MEGELENGLCYFQTRRAPSLFLRGDEFTNRELHRDEWPQLSLKVGCVHQKSCEEQDWYTNGELQRAVTIVIVLVQVSDAIFRRL